MLAFWPCVALAERRNLRAGAGTDRRTPAIAGLGLAGATLFAGLGVLGQSRGAVLAAALSIVFALALLRGRLRRIVALLVSAACLAPAMPMLLDVYRSGAADEATGDGAVALLLAGAAAGVVWSLLVAAEQRWRPSGLRPRRLAAIGVTTLAVLAAAAGVASAGRIASFVDRQYTAFVTLGGTQAASDSSRLATGAGNRYDYWRVALDAWHERPIIGVGAGGYDKPYFARRRTSEDIRQPHSLPLQVLAELGIVGWLLLAGALLAIATAGWRRIRAGGREPVMVAALGVATAWFVHTSVDWIHLLPGLTGVALVGATVLIRPVRNDAAPDAEGEPLASAPGSSSPRSRAWRFAPAIVLGVVITIAALSLSRQALSEFYVQRAQDVARERP